jgi:sortase A
MGNAVLPIAGYYVSTLPDMKLRELQSPIPPEQIVQGFPQVYAQQVEVQQPTYVQPVVLATQLDYTNLSHWFAGLNPTQATEEHEYVLSIPSIDINNAQVKIGGTNLNSSLIQYPGTADPGQPGAPVIFGHSVLRQFYNPEEDNKRRYVSIFSYIMTLKKGDKIFIKDGEVNYTYVVVDKMEVKPEDTYVLAQNPDEKLLKLITCVPEGTYLRRGVVIAQLVK